MAKRHSHKARTHRRTKKGGAMMPLSSGAYPASVMGGTSWNTNVTPGTAASAAGSWKSLLEQVAGNTGGEGASPAAASAAMSKYALTGPGPQSAPPYYGGGKKSRRQARSYARSKSQTKAKAQAQSQSGGMIASFGAMLKEALVPLGLLALNQTVGKKTRKHHNRH